MEGSGGGKEKGRKVSVQNDDDDDDEVRVGGVIDTYSQNILNKKKWNRKDKPTNPSRIIKNKIKICGRLLRSNQTKNVECVAVKFRSAFEFILVHQPPSRMRPLPRRCDTGSIASNT
eukprot:c45824_g1_i1.p1 GENE.c45824_g1_i1~~c45824_g1_i1.p1  ORF type:complete len:117 (-),score=16.53 c45824_g1_i1:65-415(-)